MPEQEINHKGGQAVYAQIEKLVAPGGIAAERVIERVGSEHQRSVHRVVGIDREGGWIAKKTGQIAQVADMRIFE